MKKTYQAPNIVVVEVDGMTLLAASTGDVNSFGIGGIIKNENEFGSSRPLQSSHGPFGGVVFDIEDDEE